MAHPAHELSSDGDSLTVCAIKPLCALGQLHLYLRECASIFTGPDANIRAASIALTASFADDSRIRPARVTRTLYPLGIR